MKTFVCGARIVESVPAASVVAMDLKNPSVRRNAGKTGGASGLILFDIDRT